MPCKRRGPFAALAALELRAMMHAINRPDGKEDCSCVLDNGIGRLAHRFGGAVELSAMGDVVNVATA
jgi:hypothetical protein